MVYLPTGISQVAHVAAAGGSGGEAVAGGTQAGRVVGGGVSWQAGKVSVQVRCKRVVGGGCRARGLQLAPAPPSPLCCPVQQEPAQEHSDWGDSDGDGGGGAGDDEADEGGDVALEEPKPHQAMVLASRRSVQCSLPGSHRFPRST